MLHLEDWADNELTLAAREVARLGLEREVYELEVFGLTIVPAERTGAAEACRRAFERACELVTERSGVAPDVESGSTHSGVFTPSLHHFLHEDVVFQELATHPMALALATMLVGGRCIVTGTELFMKGPAARASGNDLNLGMPGDGLQLGLHSDNVTVPEPFPTIANMCNVTWLLSDYTHEGGALAFVPGSHRLCRQPLKQEAVNRAVAVEAPAGSLVIWHGNTWHGSFPRVIPGLRTGMAIAMSREFMHPHEPVSRDLTDEAVSRLNGRFATLAGRSVLDWDETGPDYAKLRERPFRYSIYT